MRERFYIPMNFMESGYLFNGLVSIRNAIEAGVLSMLAYYFCKLFPIPSGLDGVPYYIFIISPVALLSVSGIRGDPLSVFVIDFFRWRRHRKPSLYSNHGKAYTAEAANALMEEPQIRDMLANVVDRVRANMSAKDIDYVEGKNFEFMDDPQQQALQQVEEEIRMGKEEALAKLQELEQQRQEEEAARNNPFAKRGGNKVVDAEAAAKMLVLDDLEWEEDE